MNICLYIHIPFCHYKCHFCDFAVFVGKEDHIQLYVDQLCKEIKQKSDQVPGVQVKSIYFGGGTPNTLTVEQYGQILSTLHSSFITHHLDELSTEMAPQGLTKEYLSKIRSLGITRVTFGLETFDDFLRKKSGRMHTLKEFLNAIAIAKEVRIKSIGADLIMGLPGQTVQRAKEDVERMTSLNLDHISNYMLVHEPNSTFGKLRDQIAYPPDEEVIQMYENAIKTLKRNGYEQYEISNWSRPGHECVYNKHVWQSHEYLGFGLSAASFFNQTRWDQTRNLKDYLAIDKFKIPSKKDIDIKTREFEKVLLGLRLNAGINKNAIKDKKLVELLKQKEDIIYQDDLFVYIGKKYLYDSTISDLYSVYMP